MTSLPATMAASLLDGNVTSAFVCAACGSRRRSDAALPRGVPAGMARCGGCGLLQSQNRITSSRLRRAACEDATNSAVSDAAAWDDAVRRYVSCLLPMENLPGRNLLDLGCGQGHLSALAKARGWRVIGIDPSAQAVSRAVERFAIDARAGWLARHREALGRFDVVLCNNLESAVDPAGLLRDVRTVLNSEGLICIDTPNGAAGLQHRVSNKALNDDQPCLNLFESDSLSRLLEACRFSEVRISYYASNAGAAFSESMAWGVVMWIPRFVARLFGRLWGMLGASGAGRSLPSAGLQSPEGALALVEAAAKQKGSSPAAVETGTRLIAVAVRSHLSSR